MDKVQLHVEVKTQTTTSPPHRWATSWDLPEKVHSATMILSVQSAGAARR